MKKLFTILASIVAAVMLSTNATAQITGVELARKQQGTAFQTNENDKVIRYVEIDAPIVVCGGGLSGVCAAVSAARQAFKFSFLVLNLFGTTLDFKFLFRQQFLQHCTVKATLSDKRFYNLVF